MADLSQLSIAQIQARRAEIEAASLALYELHELGREEEALWVELIRRAVRETDPEAHAVLDAEHPLDFQVEDMLAVLADHGL